MGIVSNGILGSVSGKVGPVVLCTYRDQEVMKTKPKKSSKPAVQSQVDQRSRFKIVTEFLPTIANIVELGYQSKEKSTSAMNRAVRYHLDNAITGVSPDFSLNYSKVRLTSVKLNTVTNVSIVPSATRLVDLSWDVPEEADMVAGNMMGTDQAAVVAYSEAEGIFYTRMAVAKREDGQCQITYPKLFLGGNVHAWLVFISADHKRAFRDVYLGSFKLIA
ncbi:DUF6266 family protein [Pedobacter sp. AW31-3R]|uniref:DUF6266 family protein n=1 Tax=Pedobacter sp. AW31-3R TaxID=3445781 RepID=UPI003F9FBDF8